MSPKNLSTVIISVHRLIRDNDVSVAVLYLILAQSRRFSEVFKENRQVGTGCITGIFQR